MVPDRRAALAPRGLIVPGTLFVNYSEYGGDLVLNPGRLGRVPRPYRIIDPRTGGTTGEGILADSDGPLVVPEPGGAPRVFVLWDGWGGQPRGGGGGRGGREKWGALRPAARPAGPPR
ncbi:hypothetical protein [Streptomyces sp. NPDC088554]|uniref:hypothetical protein n=1 Tax=Streptomyces sp. NPDC088554 TaxID=3365865 RepID=UPI003821CEBC